MNLHPLAGGGSFQNFSLLCLNANGRYVEPRQELDEFRDGREILPDQLPAYLRQKIVLPQGVTDVFVWVHGWRNDHTSGLANARRLFQGIEKVWQARRGAYSQLDRFVPAFVAVRWPSLSNPLPSGYKAIRDRTTALTERGDAEFFLAALLGYLDQQNTRVGGPGSKTLAAQGGFFVHCLGHSFGGRFLTAAIRAAAAPQAQTLHLLEQVGWAGRKVLSATADTGFQFTVDSVLIFQMAAPRSSFGPHLTTLIHRAPLRGPVLLTYSSHDRANCVWHRWAEQGELGIGCSGAAQPAEDLGEMHLCDLNHIYTESDFAKRILNVQASSIFAHSGLRPEGAHSDFWYEESVHLALSLAGFVHA